MKIKYYGHSCFLLETDGGLRLLTDPYTGIGYALPCVKAEVVVRSHDHFDHNYTEGVAGVREVIEAAGEYRCGDVKIKGIPSFHDEAKGAKRGKNVIFRFEADGVTVCHMGDIGEPASAELAEAIGQTDILMLPVGGTYTVDARGALNYIEAIRPKIVLPMHYKTNDCTLDIAPVGEFLALFGEERVQWADLLDTSKLEDYGEIVLLRRNSDG